MTTEEEILTLLRENNSLLKELVSYLRKSQTPEAITEDDIKDFCMNVVANIVASSLENNNKITSLIKESFKL